MNISRPQPQKDLPPTSEFAEFGEDQVDDTLNALIGVHLDPVILAPAVAWRQGEAEFSPACLGVAGSQTADFGNAGQRFR
jgi:hypothetical protein